MLPRRSVADTLPLPTPDAINRSLQAFPHASPKTTVERSYPLSPISTLIIHKKYTLMDVSMHVTTFM